MRRFALIGTAVVSLCAAAVAQRGNAPPQQPPTFRSGVELVRLDVSVFDADRRPMRGLAAKDFTIRENGVVQEVVVFEPVELPATVRTETVWDTEAIPDVTTNEAADGRIWVLFLDDATSQPEMWALQAVKRIARSIVDKLSAADRMAVIFSMREFDARDFTTVRARLMAAIDTYDLGFYGQGQLKNPVFANANNGPKMADQFFRSGSVKTLRMTIDHLKTAPERRRMLVYVGFGTSTTGPNSRALLEEAQHSGVQVYAFNACGFGSTDCVVGTLPNMLAEETSGQRYVPSNDFEPGIVQMFTENQSYYLIGYRTTTPEKTQFRRINVEVNRPGAEVRTRTGYFVETQREREKSAAALARLQPAAAAVTGFLPKSDLPLKIAAAPFAVPGKQEAGVIVTVGADLPDLPPTTRIVETLSMEIRAFSPAGLARGSWRQTTDVRLRAGAGAPPSAELLARIELRPGRYSIRVGVHGQTVQKTGSVYADVEIPDFANAPLSVSGVVLEAIPRPPSGGDSIVTGWLPLTPTAERTLSARQTAATFFRLYQGGRLPPEPVNVTRLVLDERGSAVQEVTDTLDAERFTANRSADVHWPVPTGELAPGKYLARFTTTLGTTTVRREIVFRIR